jgi:hypothetical protein
MREVKIFGEWLKNGTTAISPSLSSVVGKTERGMLDCEEAGRYCDRICVFSNDSSGCGSVKSRVVEYLDGFCQKPQKNVAR